LNSMARYVAVKEEHAELTKHEVRVIWGDFMKDTHAEAYPQLMEMLSMCVVRRWKAPTVEILALYRLKMCPVKLSGTSGGNNPERESHLV